MKTAASEVSPGALAALINTGQFVYATLYTITLAGGAGTLRFTGADMDILVGATTWDSRGVRVDPDGSRQKASWKRGLDMDTWLVVVLPRLVDPVTLATFPDLIGSMPWAQAARQGALSGADVQVDRAYFASWPQPYQAVASPVGTLTIFAGVVAEVDVSDTAVAITVNDYRKLLGKQMPAALYQAGCKWTLYDTGCTLIETNFDTFGTLIGGSTRSVLQSAPLVALGSGTFQLGKIKMTSGPNSNFTRTVIRWSASAPGTFNLLNPLPYDVTAGQTFTAFAGCDKTQAACTAFGNLANFRGTPFIPSPELAI